MTERGEPEHRDEGRAVGGPDAGRSPRRNPLRAASDAVVSPTLATSNPYASVAVAVGLIALFFNAFGVVPAVGVVLSVLGVVRARRLAREGVTPSGLGRAVAGLVLSAVGLVRLLPAVAQATGFLPG